MPPLLWLVMDHVFVTPSWPRVSSIWSELDKHFNWMSDTLILIPIERLTPLDINWKFIEAPQKRNETEQIPLALVMVSPCSSWLSPLLTSSSFSWQILQLVRLPLWGSAVSRSSWWGKWTDIYSERHKSPSHFKNQCLLSQLVSVSQK